MKKKIFLFALFSFIPFFISALNYKAQEALKELVAPITTGIDKHFQEYLTTSCRNAENYIRPSQDCYDYLTVKTYEIALEIEKSLQHIDRVLAEGGFSESQRKTINEELEKILLRKVIDKAEDLHKIVAKDYFAAAHMKDISSVCIKYK